MQSVSQVLCIKAESHLLQLTLGGEQQFLGKGYLPYAILRRAVLCCASSHQPYSTAWCTAALWYVELLTVTHCGRSSRSEASQLSVAVPHLWPL